MCLLKITEKHIMKQMVQKFLELGWENCNTDTKNFDTQPD